MYLDLASLKERLSIAGNWQDASLNLLLDDSRGVIESMDFDLSSKLRVKFVPSCELMYGEVYLDYPNVTAINEINDVAYTGTQWVDYLILEPKNSLVHFKNLNSSSDYVDGSYIKMEYTAGYTTIPSDLKLLQFYIILGLQLENVTMSSAFIWSSLHSPNDWIKSIELWPRKITYSDSAMLWFSSEAVDMYKNLEKKISTIVNRYKIFTI